MFSLKSLFCSSKPKDEYEDVEENNSEDIVPLSKDEEIIIEKDKDIYDEVADVLEIDSKILKAFVEVETNSTNLLDGRLIIRWETHWFKKYTNYNILVHGPRGYINKECQDSEWEAFTRARDLLCEGKYAREAYLSTSFGVGQVMGFNYHNLGFDSPQRMAEFIGESEENGIRSIGMFIKSHSKLLQACKDLDFAKIAYYYNGSAYARNKYDIKMKAEYDRLKNKA